MGTPRAETGTAGVGGSERAAGERGSRTRRRLLAGAAGVLGVAAAEVVGQAAPAQANNGNAVLQGTDNGYPTHRTAVFTPNNSEIGILADPNQSGKGSLGVYGLGQCGTASGTARSGCLPGPARTGPLRATAALATAGVRRQNRPMRLRWDAGPGLDVTDGTQLDRALDALLAGPAADRPLIAYLAGDVGALGLGLDPADCGVLLFAPADRSRPALHGTGAGPGTEDDVVFAVSGRPYQFSGRCRVPGSTVRAAARQYLATGELPDCVEWEPEPGLLSDEGQRGSA